MTIQEFATTGLSRLLRLFLQAGLRLIVQVGSARRENAVFKSPPVCDDLIGRQRQIW
tara:strand:- start:72 stop:242 length:171 start_codon:yes stop_codon:yes gene_type:complete